MRTRDLVGLPLLLIVIAFGCQPAERYSYKPNPTSPDTPPPPPPAHPQPPPPLDPRLVWEPSRAPSAGDVPLIFVAESKEPARWAALPRFWNPSPLLEPTVVASLVGDPLETITR